MRASRGRGRRRPPPRPSPWPWRRWLAALAALAVITWAGARTAQATGSQQSWPGLADLVSAHLTLGLVLSPAELPQTLYATHPDHRPVLARLLDLIARSSPSAGSLAAPPRTPALRLVLKSGGGITLRPAYDCESAPTESGLVQTCHHAIGEVVVESPPGKLARLVNPALDQWLWQEWQADLPTGAARPLDRAAALAIAREVSALAPWRAAHEAEYPVEGKGGTELYDVWVLKAEHPGGHKTVLVIDALTGRVITRSHLEGPES